MGGSMTAVTREYLKRTLSKLGKENCESLMMGFDLIAEQRGESVALDVILEAGKQLLYQCNASATLPLNHNAKQIYDSLNEFTKNKSVQLDSKKLMYRSVEKMNSLIGKVEFRVVYNGQIFGLDDSGLQELKVTIPKALQDRERLHESYAASDVKSRIKELSVMIKY
jgi:hypothetical protein